MKLSTPQRRMLSLLVKEGEAYPPWGNRAAGRAAAAWHRTVDSLIRMGLATRRLHEPARPTQAGIEWLQRSGL